MIKNRDREVDIENRDRNDHRKIVAQFTVHDLRLSICDFPRKNDRGDHDFFDKYRCYRIIGKKSSKIREGGGCLIF